jgi:phosphohistidine swiveling domain-containing protein
MEQSPVLWTAGFFNERFPAPISPLAWSVLGPLIEDIALRDPLRYLGYPAAETMPLTRLWQGHPYTNVAAFQMFYKVFPDFIMPEDAYRYFPDGDVRLRKEAPYPRSIFSPRFLFSILRAFLSDPQDFSPWHNYRKWADYTREHDRQVAALRSRLEALEQAEPSAILTALDEASAAHRALLHIHRWSLMHADLTYSLLKRLARAWIDAERGNDIAAQIVGEVPNKTMEVDAALHHLAVLGDDVLSEITTYSEFVERASAAAREAFQAFLAEHGHRSFSLDIALPTFEEDPNQVVRLLRLMEVAPQHEQRPDSASIPKAPRPFWQRWIFGAVQGLAERYVALRENQRYYWQKSLAVTRRLYLLLGDRLVAQGVIPRADEVLYATRSELVDYFSGRLAKQTLALSIASRRAEWAGYQAEYARSPANAYPLFLRGDSPLVENQMQQEAWQGRAVSPGTARGMARVVLASTELALIQRGEILIAPSTDPAWTPVFGKIAGLVLERGGVLSHGAVVAREYHVPAVAGIANIAEEIHDGEMIEVDGTAGLVTRVRK